MTPDIDSIIRQARIDRARAIRALSQQVFRFLSTLLSPKGRVRHG